MGKVMCEATGFILSTLGLTKRFTQIIYWNYLQFYPWHVNFTNFDFAFKTYVYFYENF